ncbi:radical SAM protein [Enterococcus faecalis]
MKQSDYNILTQDDEGKTILFNSMTGSVFRLDDRVSEIIQMDQIEKFEKKEIDLLKKHGMIVDKNNSQLSNYDYYHNLQKYSNDMLGITWLTTWGCNLSCTYCFEGDNKDSTIVSSHEEIDRLLKFIEQNYHRTRFKYLAVTLFGGEPMMNYKGIKLALPKMKEFCVKNDVIFIVNMVSNGLLLTENNVKFLTENGLETIQITVDGSRELHNTKRIY